MWLTDQPNPHTVKQYRKEKNMTLIMIGMIGLIACLVLGVAYAPHPMQEESLASNMAFYGAVAFAALLYIAWKS